MISDTSLVLFLILIEIVSSELDKEVESTNQMTISNIKDSVHNHGLAI